MCIALSTNPAAESSRCAGIDQRDDPPFLTTAAVARLSGLSSHTIALHARDGRLRSVRIGNYRFFATDNVRLWIDARRRKRLGVELPGALDPDSRLTVREREIVGHILRGAKTRDIAASLGIAVQTVHAHLRHIRLKLGVHRIRDVVGRFAIVEG